MKKLKIAQIAPLWVSIPPEKYGGIELVVSALTEELVKRGHDVTLFASGDSKTSAKLESIYPRALLKDGIPWKDTAYDIMNLSEAFKRADEFDIMHSHIDLYDLFFTSFVKTPIVSTMHNNMFSSRGNSGRLLAYRHYAKNNFVSISKAQAQNSFKEMNWVGNVYNGLDPEQYKLNLAPEDKFIWIARVDEVKGVLNAISVAENLGIRLDIAGRVDVAREEFFNDRIKPRLNERIRYVGEIEQSQKAEFFGSGKALLYPIEWEEPFGMVMIEAMACGTPVIAFDRGSVSEVVKDGHSGFVVKTLDEMCGAVKEIDQIDREACRQWFDDNFTAAKMVDGYERAYEKILSKASANNLKVNSPINSSQSVRLQKVHRLAERILGSIDVNN